jgi:PAS domain S-box-containing protein
MPAWSEAARVAALARYGILDTPTEPHFDEITRIAVDICEAPIAVVNFITTDRQWFKAEVGIGARELPLDVSICRHAILQPGLFVVPDLAADARFSGNPLVQQAGGLRFYAGALLETPEGLPIGTVCVLDTQPRPAGLGERQARLLRSLARQVMAELELRRAVLERERELRRALEAEAAVREREATLSAVLDALPVGVIIADPSGRILRDNAANRALWGILPVTESWEGYADWEGYWPDSGKRIQAHEWALARAVLRGEVVRGELVECQPFDGAPRRSYLNNAAPVRGPDGRIIGGVAAELDVTEARQVEAALAESRTRLQAALEASATGTWHWDLRSGVVVWDEALDRVYGMRPGETARTVEGFLARVHPDDRDRLAEACERCVREAIDYEAEFRVLWPDGQVRWLFGKGKAYRDAAGTPAYMTGATTDITNRRRAEEAWRETEALLRLSEQAARVASYVQTLPGDDIHLAPNALTFAGFPPEKVVIPPVELDAIIHPEDRARLAAERETFASRGAASVHYEYRVLRPDNGEVVHIEQRGRCEYDRAGRPVRASGVVIDVTARREAEAVLARDKEELERLVAERTRELTEVQSALAHAERMRALGQLAGGIAHDMNNVLQAASSGAALLERSSSDPARVRQLAGQIGAAAMRGSGITGRLLAFARRSELRTEAVEPARLLTELQEVLARTLGTGVRVEVAAATTLPAVLADQGQLETVLVNLATNARDAMVAGGTVTLAASTEVVRGERHLRYSRSLSAGSYVRMSVHDTGTGMSDEVLARVTEPFFTTKELGKGTGLGLAMARGFAEQSGGGFELESEVGRGTTVHLWLPLAGDDEGAAGSGRRHWESRGREAARYLGCILAVDDDPLVLEPLLEQLRRRGHEAIPARGGAEALALLRTGQRVDLVLSDLSMPGMDGVTLLAEARRLRPGLPAILLTGFPAENGKCLPSDATALLLKPVEEGELLACIDELLERAAAVYSGNLPSGSGVA